MISAVMRFALVVTAVPGMMLMMLAMSVGIIIQRSGGKSTCCFIRWALYPGIEFDPGIRQRHLCAHANAAADQCVCLGRLQESRQRAVPTAVSIDDLLSNDFSVFHIIQLKLLAMAKMLEYFPVFISDCNSHCVGSFLHDGLV